jgi:hypothetical protein
VLFCEALVKSAGQLVERGGGRGVAVGRRGSGGGREIGGDLLRHLLYWVGFDC